MECLKIPLNLVKYPALFFAGIRPTANEKNLDVDLVRAAEKQTNELKRLGAKVDPEFRVEGPFEGKSSFRFQTTK